MMNALRKHLQLLSAIVDKALFGHQKLFFLVGIVIFLLMFFLYICINNKIPDQIDNKIPDKPAVKMLATSKYWVLVNDAFFTDGGSVALSFMNEKGEVVHIWEDNSFESLRHDRKFYLKTKYNDPNRVEIKHGSFLEQKVLEMIEECSDGDEFPQPPRTISSMCNNLSEHLRDRERGQERSEKGVSPEWH